LWWLARGRVKSNQGRGRTQPKWERRRLAPRPDNNTLDLPWRPIACIIHPHRVPSLSPSVSAFQGPVRLSSLVTVAAICPPVSTESCLPVPLSLRAAVSPPVLVETPSLPHLQSLNKLPDRQNLRRRPLRLSTPPANISPPPNRHVYLDESHHTTTSAT
jgi:hypothetical protein